MMERDFMMSLSDDSQADIINDLSSISRYSGVVLNINNPYFEGIITKTCLYDIDPLKPHFYIVKLGFTGVYIIILISAKKHRLWVLVRTASVLTSTDNLCFE